MHWEIIHEECDVTAIIDLKQCHDILSKIIRIYGILLNLYQFFTPLVRDSSNCSHVTRRHYWQVSCCILASMAICTSHAALPRKGYFIYEDDSLLGTKGRENVLEDLLSSLLVLHSWLRSRSLNLFDCFESNPAILVDLRDAPRLDEYLGESPVKQNTSLCKRPARPLSQRFATLKECDMLFSKHILICISFWPTKWILDSRPDNTYFFLRMVSGLLCLMMSRTVSTFKRVYLAI